MIILPENRRAFEEMKQLATDFKSREINVRQLDLKMKYAVKEHGASAMAEALHATALAQGFEDVLPPLFKAAAKTQTPEFKEILRTWFEHSSFSRHAAEGLVHYGEEIAPYFSSYATQPENDALNRIVALKALAKINYPTPALGADVLKKVARTAAVDSNYLVRKTALETTREIASGEMPPETLADVTEKLLQRRPKQEDEILIHQMALNRVLSSAQNALRGNKTEEANNAAYRIAEAVAKATANPDDFVRGIAANTLGQLGVHGGRHANTLAFLATNPDTSESVRRDAAAALASVADHVPKQFVKKIAENIGDAMVWEENSLTVASMAETLHKLGKPGQEKLWQLFKHPSEAGRVAAYWLGKTPANTQKLLHFLNHENKLVQARAANGLGSLRFAPAKVDAELALAATDETKAPEVRREAARSLVLRGKPKLAEKIFASLETPRKTKRK